jgi:AcrR family transcriptional regulator
VARTHTGRARNDATRQAIVDATVRLLATDGPSVSVDAIAAAAGAGKQTVYRWWRSRGALLLEALRERARIDVPPPDTGTLRGDLEQFIAETFRQARKPDVAALLRASMRDALGDPAALTELQEFTDDRRRNLAAVLGRAAQDRMHRSAADAELAADITFGVLWYRVLLGREQLERRHATALANVVASCWQNGAPPKSTSNDLTPQN